MLSIAYIVSAYKLPRQLTRLVRALQRPQHTFYIHVDANSESAMHDAVRSTLEGDDNVEMLPPHVCEWGDFGHVRATLKGLDRLVASGTRYDYVALLTGQDYPIKSGQRTEEYLEARHGQSFMNFRPLPVDGLEEGGYARLPSRELPNALTPYFGSGYWTLHRRAIEHIHEFLGSHPEYVSYFERVRIPDEMFFQTILVNSPLRATLVNDDLRLIKWPGPAVLTSADLDEIKRAPDLLARKFDETVDAAVLDEIDRWIG
jgi:hypothetical protein